MKQSPIRLRPDLQMLGVVLTGGEGRRMGGNKPEMLVGGRPMWWWVWQQLRAVCSEVIWAGKPLTDPDLSGVLDPGGMEHLGPLTGVTSGLAAASGRWVLTVGVDHPWVQLSTLQLLVSRAEQNPVVPYWLGYRQTTCALYPSHIHNHAFDQLTRKGSLQSLLDIIPVEMVYEAELMSAGEDGRSFFSVNRLTDLHLGLGRYGPPG